MAEKGRNQEGLFGLVVLDRASYVARIESIRLYMNTIDLAQYVNLRDNQKGWQ